MQLHGGVGGCVRTTRKGVGGRGGGGGGGVTRAKQQLGAMHPSSRADSKLDWQGW